MDIVMDNITGAIYRVSRILKTKRNEVQPGKLSVKPTSVQKAMSSSGSGTTEVMAHRRRLVGNCSKHVQLPRETHGRRASGRPGHQSRRVSGPEVTAVAICGSQVEVISEVQRCRAMKAPVDQHKRSSW